LGIDFFPFFFHNGTRYFLRFLKTAKEIVAEAWNITVEHKNRLFHLGFVPSLFSILVTGWYLFYQVQSFRHSPIFSQEKSEFLFSFLLDVWEILSIHSGILFFSLLCLFIIFVGWFFTPMLCRGAITHLTAQAYFGKRLERGFFTAFFRFFPLFEVTALASAIKPTAIFSAFSFLGRHVPGLISLSIPFFLIFFIFGSIVLFFLSFTTQAIILRNALFIDSVKCSFKVVLEHFSKTLAILFLFLLVELRVLVNILVVLALPILIVGATGLLAGLFSYQVGILVAAGIFFLLVFSAAYLTGILFVFSEAVWTVAFLEFMQDIEQKEARDEKIRSTIS
jgi:hypothetical protein